MQQQQRQLTAGSQRRRDGELIAVCGKSRSGKSAWLMQRLAKERSLLVWDVKPEWSMKAKCKLVTTPRDLAALIKPGMPPVRIGYNVPATDENFEVFCRLAWLGINAGTVQNLVIEETADVTNPGKAPVAYGMIIRQGLGFGCNIYPTTQRVAESDKTAVGNATVIHTHMLKRADDRKYIARELDIPVTMVEALKPLQWIERHDDGSLRQGVVTFKKSRK